MVGDDWIFVMLFVIKVFLCLYIFLVGWIGVKVFYGFVLFVIVIYVICFWLLGDELVGKVIV